MQQRGSEEQERLCSNAMRTRHGRYSFRRMACVSLWLALWAALPVVARGQVADPKAVPAAAPSVDTKKPATGATVPRARKDPIEFDRDIQPIFAAHCVKCHGPMR